MSFTSDPAVQPEGQGGAQGDPPYAEFLTRFPEEHRSTAESAFKEWDSSVTRRFQEASEYRRQWEPYEQIGINQWDPQELAGLVEFSRLANDPLRADEWRSVVEGLARQHGVLGEQTQTPEIDTELLDPAVEQLLESRTAPLQQEIEQMRQWREQFETQQQQQQIQSQLQAEFDALQREHGELPQEMLVQLAGKYVGQDPRPIARAFQDLQSYRGSVEQQVLRSKLRQPGTPETTGGADTSVQRPRTLKEAQQAMVERLQASAAM